MYDYITGNIGGKVSSSTGCKITIEAGGIGYLIEVTSKDFATIDKDSAKIYVVLIHREDKMSLCGFLHKEDRDIFNILTSVSGVGSKMALSLLDEFDSSELIGYVIQGNYKEITRTKGIGPKLAQKIILELKDKLMNYKECEPIVIESANNVQSQDIEDAQSVLTSLGYEREEIKSGISKALTVLGSNPTAEDILKTTLRILSS